MESRVRNRLRAGLGEGHGGAAGKGTWNGYHGQAMGRICAPRTWKLHRRFAGGLATVDDLSSLFRPLVRVCVVVVHREARALHGVSVHVRVRDGTPSSFATLLPKCLNESRDRWVGIAYDIWPVVRVRNLRQQRAEL